MHKTEKKNIALCCDDEWEGECNGYATVLKVPEGYRSYVMFGDSTKRKVEFEKPLSWLHGQKLRLKFHLKDAHLYSFEPE